MKKGITQGDYLRILERTLKVFDINWFDIGIQKTSIRCLYKDGNKWIIKDYLGFKDNDDKSIEIMDDSDPIKYPDYMNTICKKVIHYVAYDTDQEKELIDYLKMEIEELRYEISDTELLPRVLQEKGLVEDSYLPEVYYHEWEDIVCFLSGYDSIKEVSEIYNKIKPCRCGGNVELHEYAGMGELNYIIKCKSCTNSLSRGIYDNKDLNDTETHENELLNELIDNWNNGVRQDEIDRISETEISRIKLQDSDLEWKEYRANNMEENDVEGLYSLVFYNNEGKIYCCKWTIEYQLEEKEPGHIPYDAEIVAYNLYMKRFFEIEGNLHYPEPLKRDAYLFSEEKGYITFSNSGINDKGVFVRSYPTLKKAKEGVLGRCGWQGINRDTIVIVKDN